MLGYVVLALNVELIHCKISFFFRTNLLLFPVFSTKNSKKSMKGFFKKICRASLVKELDKFLFSSFTFCFRCSLKMSYFSCKKILGLIFLHCQVLRAFTLSHFFFFWNIKKDLWLKNFFPRNLWLNNSYCTK